VDQHPLGKRAVSHGAIQVGDGLQGFLGGHRAAGGVVNRAKRLGDRLHRHEGGRQRVVAVDHAVVVDVQLDFCA